MTSLSDNIISHDNLKTNELLPHNKDDLLNNLKQMGPTADINDWADFWFYIIGVNIFPADTKNKVTYEKWSEWQNNSISIDLHCEWKETNKYSKGIALIPGKVWRGPNKDKLFVFIDLDNQKAIDEVCKVFNCKDLAFLSDYVIVEQHNDDKSKAHFYFYSNHVFSKKSADANKLKDEIDTNEIPAIEVKGLGQHGVAYCSPSVHKNGYNYEIIGTLEPKTCGKGVEDLLFKIYKKYGLCIDNESKIPIEKLFDDDFVVCRGHNRHEALLRIMTSLIKRNKPILGLEQIKKMSYALNEKKCIPPLEDNEFEKQWKCAIKFIDRKLNKDFDTSDSNNNQIISSTKQKRVTLIERAAEEILDNNHFLNNPRIKRIFCIIKMVFILMAAKL
ncbi:MAG: bifunctional DNA primase/polymerase [Nitrosopumilus sp.]|nr:bifunctional DNA primase/polymerase [Nitrosopumilus sp.]